MAERSTQLDTVGPAMHALLRELMPHFRGLGGEGNRQTLGRIAEMFPLTTHAVASGTPVFDWTVPKRWTFRDAWIKDASGRKVVDAERLNLHVSTHSRPHLATMSFDELRPFLHTRPDRPSLVPYRHTFYTDGWGFCLSHDQLDAMQRADAGPYEVCIDADLEDADDALLYGECELPGTDDAGEVVFSAHSCHPSMANDNLSGVVVQAYLAQWLAQRPAPNPGAWRPTYRFVFAPATVGVIAWLHNNRDRLPRIIGGATLANVGDAAPLAYRLSRQGDTAIDRAAASVLPADRIGGFDPTGGDERQFGSPGLNLPVGALMRSAPGAYPEYHTSADDETFVTPDALAGTLDACIAICEAIEAGGPAVATTQPSTAGMLPVSPGCPVNRVGCGEPQLGKYGILEAVRALPDPAAIYRAVLWTLNLADGRHDLAAMAKRSGFPLPVIQQAASLLERFELIETQPEASAAPDSRAAGVNP